MKEQTDTRHILIIEDSAADAFLIQQQLSQSGIPIAAMQVTERLAEAEILLKEQAISLVFLDLSLPDNNGLQSFLQLKPLVQKIPVIILTGLSDSGLAAEALKQGAQDYLVKGDFNTASLVKSMQYSTERKKAELNILLSEEKYRQVFYRNPFPMWIQDTETERLLEVNDAALKHYGYRRDEFLRLSVTDLQMASPSELLSMLPVKPRNIKVHKKKNGEGLVVEITLNEIDYFGQTAMQVQVNDITEKTRLQKELAEKKRQLIEAVLNAQESERRAIGEELHDNVNQILTAVKLMLGWVQEEGSGSKELIDKCINNIAQAIEENRKISRELIVPGNLRELGLLFSLEILAKDIGQITSIKIAIDTSGIETVSLSEEQKVTIYRIVQEQLNNIIKYAQASSVIIRIDIYGGQIHLSVTDDGKGFDKAAIRKGIGLYNIANRAELFGGEMQVITSPGKGCALHVTMAAKYTEVVNR